jgi:hypothetical protein
MFYTTALNDSAANCHIWFSGAAGGDRTVIYADTTNTFHIRTAGTYDSQFTNAGNFIIPGSTGQKAAGTTWANPSDERIKTDISDYEAGLDEIVGLRPVTYRYREEAKQAPDLHVGLIAQEAEQVMPSLVTTAPGSVGDLAFDDFKTLDASNVIWALVNAVKALKAEIDVLKGGQPRV